MPTFSRLTYLLTGLVIMSFSSAEAGRESYQLARGLHQLEVEKHPKRVGLRAASTHQEANQEGLMGSELATHFETNQPLGGFRLFTFDGDDADAHLNTLRSRDSVQTGTHTYVIPGTNVPLVPTGELYIRFHFKTTGTRSAEILAAHGLERHGSKEYVVKVTPASHNPFETAFLLAALSEVEKVEPDFAVPIQRLGFDSLVNDQWHLKNTGECRGTTKGLKAGADARVIEAWDVLEANFGEGRRYGSQDVTVAIIDDGFDLNHPDIGAGRVAHPRDFTRDSDDPRPDDGDWHGTSCAGVAVGALGGGDILGAAPTSRFIPIRWGYGLSDGEVEAWFDFAMQNGADIVSNSWGAAADFFPLSTRQWKAIYRCATEGRGGKGCVVVFAAGNSNHNINAPKSGTLDGFATHPRVIAVAASTSMDERSDYSNYGLEISVSAPSSGKGGMGILTADVEGKPGYSPTDYTYDFGGTSSACPLVAGIAGLVLSANPELTALEVRDILEKTARKIGGETGFSYEFGHGCVNAKAAVEMALERRK